MKNLLWLFEEFSDIKNEFISLLTYSIDDLQLEIPEPQLFEEKQIEKRERTWEERLKNIQPGKEFFKEYEKICTEILKNILESIWAYGLCKSIQMKSYTVLTYVVKSKMEWIRISLTQYKIILIQNI